MMNANTSVASSDIGARIKRGIIKALEYLALIFASFVALLPIVSSFITSFKSADEYAATNAMTPPQNWLNFENYRQVWVEGDMLRAFLTSFSVVIVVVLVRWNQQYIVKSYAVSDNPAHILSPPV